MSKHSEKGVALILTLILVLVMSVMAVSLMFISQTETWSSLNYRIMSQARDGAEAGINSAANYIVNSYTQPGGVGDPTTGYNTTVSPVQYPSTATSGHDVFLSANTDQSSNYPVLSVQNTFNTTGIGKDSLTAGNFNVAYNTYATLLSMRQAFKPFGSTQNTTVQTWKIVSDGSLAAIRAGKVQVSAILERHVTPTFNYAAFATSANCDALEFSGGGSTDSYDDANAVSGTVATQTFGGNVGTNGNLTSSNNMAIYGSLSTPRTGVGNCVNGNPDAWTGNGTVSGGIVQLPQPVVYPPPAAPSPMPSTVTESASNDCGTIHTTPPGCTDAGVNSKIIWLAPTQYGNVSAGSGVAIHLSSGVYNINSLSMGSNATMIIDSSPIVINLAGQGFDSTGTVLTMQGGGGTGSIQNLSLNPINFQIVYGGLGTIKLAGGAQTAALVYAPSATINLSGNSPWYGALLGGTVKNTGGASIHYDRHLQNEAFTIGPWMLDSFTWRKY